LENVIIVTSYTWLIYRKNTSMQLNRTAAKIQIYFAAVYDLNVPLLLTEKYFAF